MGDLQRQRRSSLLGQALSRFPILARWWASRYRAVATSDAPFVHVHKPLQQLRLALITTGGVHLRSQPSFNMADSQGDASFRAIPASTPPADLMITHDYYDHTDADRDLNILFPLEHLRMLVDHGILAGLGTAYGFMGHIEGPHVEVLLRQTAPEVARLLRQEQIDAVLLTPA